MPPRPKLPLSEQTESSLAPDPSDPQPSTALATVSVPEMGLAIAQAELAALQNMAEGVGVQLLDGLAEMRKMTVPEMLVMIRVAKARLDTLQTIVLQQAVLA